MGIIKTTSFTGEQSEFQYEIIAKSDNGGYEEIDYIIYKDEKKKGWEHFVFNILNIDDERFMLYWVDNGGYPSVSNKGILKPMLYEIQKLYNKDIVSSTNAGTKVLPSEGRIQDMTDFWDRFKSKNSMVDYLPFEDRYILKK